MNSVRFNQIELFVDGSGDPWSARTSAGSMLATYVLLDDHVVRFVLDGKTDIVNISPSDGAGFCECDPCRALDVPGLQYGEDASAGIELFDMDTDPKQYTNLADNPSHKPIVDRFKSMLELKLKQVRDHDLPKPTRPPSQK